MGKSFLPNSQPQRVSAVTATGVPATKRRTQLLSAALRDRATYAPFMSKNPGFKMSCKFPKVTQLQSCSS